MVRIGGTEPGQSKRVVIKKGDITYDITADRVKEYKYNPRNPNSYYGGDGVNFKKRGVPKGSRRITGGKSGKGHKRTPTQNEKNLIYQHHK